MKIVAAMYIVTLVQAVLLLYAIFWSKWNEQPFRSFISLTLLTIGALMLLNNSSSNPWLASVGVVVMGMGHILATVSYWTNKYTPTFIFAISVLCTSVGAVLAGVWILRLVG